MVNIEEQQPHLKLSPAILSYYGQNTAVLYAYLKYYWEQNEIEVTPFMENPYYQFTLSRYDIRQVTGLSNGEQIDAELDLCGAFLADAQSDGSDEVGYDFYPHHEDEVRRWIYKKQMKFFFPDELKA
jgi:hypothetical protein